MKWKVSQLAQLVGGLVEGEGSTEIIGLASLEEAYPGSLIFADSAKKIEIGEKSSASVMLLDHKAPAVMKTSLRVDNVRLAYARIAQLFHQEYFHFGQISELAYIHPQSQLGLGVTVHPFAVIEKGAIIEEGAMIGHGSFIGHNCKVGKNTIIYPAVQIVAATEIGSEVIIHSGVVIGCDGFGYVSGPEGQHKVPQLGRVVLEDKVEIGANTVIDRASLTETRIKAGTKIDAQVMIAHNVQIGENCILVAQAGIAGSAKLGNNVVLGGQTGVVDHIEICDDVLLGGGSIFTKNITKGGHYFGFPAQNAREAYKKQAHFNRLDRYRKDIKNLEERVSFLENKIKEKD